MYSQHIIDLLHDIDVWVVIGLVGQFMFTMRFIMQWLASEKAKKSVMPVSFWFFSISGGLIVLLYAIHKKDPVFIIGQGAGLLVYFRNLYFIFIERKQSALPPK